MFSIEDFDSKTQAELKKIKSPEDVIRMFEVLDIRDFNEMFDWKYKILPKYVADCTLNCYMRYIFILFIFNEILSKYGYDGKILIGLPNIPVVYKNLYILFLLIVCVPVTKVNSIFTKYNFLL